MKKHIYLTGFMGAGKSRIGRTLAAEWDWPFYDTDALIEQKTGKVILDIFEDEGEPAFRNYEKEMILHLATEKFPSIISLGGGALMQPDNDELIRQTGLLIYIKSAPEYIFKRVHHTDKRPLLKVKRDQNFDTELMKEIRNLLAEREPVYALADIIYMRDGLEPEEIVPQLNILIRKKWKEKNEND